MANTPSNGLLPIHRTIEYSETGLKFVRGWIQLAFPIGLVLPVIALLVWFKYPEPKTIFSFYFLLLVIQLITEQIVNSFWSPSLVVVVGSLYTVFRVWQLIQGLQLIKTAQQKSQYKLVSSVLWLMLLFWLGNIIVLLTLAWPSIL
jgi:hypothetical protein